VSQVKHHEHSFSIKTEVFEGPLELLLDLVEKRKLLINDISLAAVTDEYMNQVAQMQEMSLPGTANFIALAATLLLIKSKSLLPVLELTEEEEETIDDLENRLRLYQIYREAARNIGADFGIAISHEREFILEKKPLFHPDVFCTALELKEAMYRVIKELPVIEVKPRVQVKKVISLEEMMDRLQRRIESQIKLKFSELLENDAERTVVIVGFLAILESVKQGTILVAQLQRFHDIEIETSGTSIPRYH
jgi:segregation and condensation protein A